MSYSKPHRSDIGEARTPQSQVKHSTTETLALNMESVNVKIHMFSQLSILYCHII